MDKRYFIELTNKLYRLTFFFPAKEPLRNRIRELGDEILSKLVLILEGEIQERREAAFCVERNIEMLDVLLELSKSQNWIEEEEIGKVQKNYDAIQKEIKEFNDISRRQMEKMGGLYNKEKLLQGSEKPKEEKKEKETGFIKKQEKQDKADNKFNERQEKIIELLRKKDRMQVKDFQEFLKDATKRTLRRDLSDLVDQKIIERTGKGNMTYYTGKAIGQKVG